MQQITELQKELLSNSQKAIQAFNSGNTNLALSIINNDVTKYNKDIFKLTTELLAYHDEQLQKVDQSVNQTVSRAIVIAISLLIASTIIGLYFMHFVKTPLFYHYVRPSEQQIH